MLREEVQRYQQITGKSAENVSIMAIGAFLDGYDMATEVLKQSSKTEKCKWIRYDYRTICPQNHDIDNPYWRILEERTDTLRYCPYCGKEIEVEK